MLMKEAKIVCFIVRYHRLIAAHQSVVSHAHETQFQVKNLCH